VVLFLCTVPVDVVVKRFYWLIFSNISKQKKSSKKSHTKLAVYGNYNETKRSILLFFFSFSNFKISQSILYLSLYTFDMRPSPSLTLDELIVFVIVISRSIGRVRHALLVKV
jgi:hypothetical protein